MASIVGIFWSIKYGRIWSIAKKHSNRQHPQTNEYCNSVCIGTEAFTFHDPRGQKAGLTLATLSRQLCLKWHPLGMERLRERESTAVASGSKVSCCSVCTLTRTLTMSRSGLTVTLEKSDSFGAFSLSKRDKTVVLLVPAICPKMPKRIIGRMPSRAWEQVVGACRWGT